MTKKKPNTGLTNPLQLLTNKNMFSAASFADMKISDKLVGSDFVDELQIEVLKSPNVFGFSQPTIAQSYAIPEILKGGDVMIKSETGSGMSLS